VANPRDCASTTGPSSSERRWPSGANKHGVKLLFIQPGRPMQNRFIERFNRTYRQEVLNCYVFETLGEVRRMTEDWQQRYNEERTQESLGKLTPREYLMAKST